MFRVSKGRGVKGNIDAKGVDIKDGGDKGIDITDEEFVIGTGIKVVGIGVNPNFWLPCESISVSFENLCFPSKDCKDIFSEDVVIDGSIDCMGVPAIDSEFIGLE